MTNLPNDNLTSNSNQLLASTTLIVCLWLRLRRKRSFQRISLFPAIRKLSARYGDLLHHSVSRRCFSSLYRMSRETFRNLMYKAGLYLQRDNSMATRLGNSVNSQQHRLEITLFFLAGGRYQDIFKSYKCGPSTVYKIFHETCEALNKVLQFEGLPATDDAYRNIADEFKTFRRTPSPLRGCIGALDGILIRIACPEKMHNPATFYCRKGYYALPVQALASYDYRFLFVSIKCAGFTHDPLCFNLSELGRNLVEKGLPIGIWIVGDEAYTCSEFLITPVPLSKATDWEKVLNYFLSSLRIVVEQAFGILVSKFTMLKKGLKFDLASNTRVVAICMKLHNFIIENEGCRVIPKYSSEDSEKVKEHCEDWYNLCGEANNVTDEVSVKRSDMIRIVEQLKMKRPYAHPASRAS